MNDSRRFDPLIFLIFLGALVVLRTILAGERTLTPTRVVVTSDDTPITPSIVSLITAVQNETPSCASPTPEPSQHTETGTFPRS